MQKLLFRMTAEAHQEAQNQLKREGKKISNFVAKYYFREKKLVGKILWKKVRNEIDPKDSENFGKYLQDLKEKHDLIEIASDAEDAKDSSDDSDTYAETDREHCMRICKMSNDGCTTAEILEKSRKIWNGIKKIDL